MRLTPDSWRLAVAVVTAVSVGVAAGCGDDSLDALKAKAKDTQCFAEFDSSASAEAAVAEGQDAGFGVLRQSGNVEGAFIFATGKTGEEAIPLERSFDRIVRRHHGHFGGTPHCVEHSPFD